MSAEQFPHECTVLAEAVEHLRKNKPLIEVVYVRDTPVLILLDADSGLLPHQVACMPLPDDSPLVGCPILLRRAGTTVELLDRPQLVAALCQLPQKELAALVQQLYTALTEDLRHLSGRIFYEQLALRTYGNVELTHKEMELLSKAHNCGRCPHKLWFHEYSSCRVPDCQCKEGLDPREC